jgi:Tfp pilus assembly protein PilZ
VAKGGDERREHQRTPIRLKVAYKTAGSLVSEYARSLGEGGCVLESKRSLPAGTQFVFEMYVPGVRQPVEVEAKVVRSTPSQRAGMHRIEVEYTSAEAERAPLEQVLKRIFEAQQWERSRKHARVPVHIPALEGARACLIRDVSLGGLGVSFPGQKLPAGVKRGTALGVTLDLPPFSRVQIKGEVVWAVPGAEKVDAAVGIKFGKLEGDAQGVVELLTRLARPKRVEITFLIAAAVTAAKKKP